MLKLVLRLSALLVILNVTHTTLSLEAADVPSVVGPPPIAKKIPKVTEVNGYKLVDNYFWLRDKKNPEVKAYLDAENAYRYRHAPLPPELRRVTAELASACYDPQRLPRAIIFQTRCHG